MKVPKLIAEGTPKKKESNKQIKKQKAVQAKSILDFAIENIGSIAEELEITEEKPSFMQNISSLVSTYRMRKENVKQVLPIEYKHKAEEEWLDMYIIEYKEFNLQEDCWGLVNMQKIQEEDKEYEGSSTFLIKDNFMVIMGYGVKCLKDSQEKLSKHYEDVFGMKKVKQKFEFVD